MRALLWAVMMLIWLAGLLYGVWWVWPHFARLRLTTDLVCLGWLVHPCDRSGKGHIDRVRAAVVD